MLDTASQGYEFLAAVYTGLVIGLFYTLCTFVRRLFKHHAVASAITDTLFWIVVGAGVFAAMHFINGARPRWYLFLGLAVGLALHFCSIGIIIKKISLFISAKRKANQPSEADKWPKRRKNRKNAVG